MTGVYNLNNNVKIQDLYKDLDKEQLEKIEKAADGGFSVDELKTLEEAGIDTSLIKNNSTQEEGEKVTSKTQSNADVQMKIDEIVSKYKTSSMSVSGDAYSADNPQLVALNQALDDGLILELGDEGFTKTQILTIIAGAFPSVGIAPTGEDGSYTRPYGHGDEASQIYSRFTSHLLAATGEDSEEIQAKKAELAKISSQIANNNHNMQVLEVTIEALQSDVEEQINQAIEESEEIAEENKKQAQEAVTNRLNEYKSANGEMTYEEFQQLISGDLSGIQTKTGRALSDVIVSMIDANHKMNLLKGYVSEMSELMSNNETLTAQAANVQDEIKDLTQQQAEQAGDGDPQASCTDPIGFSTDTARYDFFVDSDNNEDITNANEFLGATDGFAEMEALDTDGDGKVTGAEMDAGNVKVVKTNTDGTQEIVNASDVFTNAQDGIDLNSYKGTNQDIGDGNTLLGTFSATVNGQSLDGYQTLDTQEWLDENYEFTDEVEGKGQYAQDIEGVVEAVDFSEKINLFTIKNEELDANLKQAWSNLGLTEAQAQDIIAISQTESEVEGSDVARKFEEIARVEEEKEAQLEEDKVLEEWKVQKEAEAAEVAEKEAAELEEKELEEKEKEKERRIIIK